jgi:hypothetical protein
MRRFFVWWRELSRRLFYHDRINNEPRKTITWWG